jgi:hypothetical protein
MVVREMKKRLEKAGLTLIGAAVSLIGPPLVRAHLIDERPGLGKGMTIILLVFWVAVAVGIVCLVRRLMRPRHETAGNESEKNNYGEKEKRPKEKD